MRWFLALLALSAMALSVWQLETDRAGLEIAPKGASLFGEGAKRLIQSG
jgi:hypothetical protein